MRAKKIFIAKACFTGNRFDEDIAICTDNGIIENIVPINTLDLANAATIDMSQYILIPPFREEHMHFMVNGRPADSGEVQEILIIYRNSGILSITDAGLKTSPGIALKKAHHGYPVIASAGYAIYKHGSYGSFLGRGVRNKREIKDTVTALCDAGADFIKVINSGVVSTHMPYHVTEGGFSPEELELIIGEASQRGKEVVCHANSDMAVRNAVEAGASSIVHGCFVREETLCMMAEKKVSFVPTIYALKSILPFSEAGDSKHSMEIIAGHIKTVRLASDLGVELKVGSDSGAKGLEHGEGFFREVEAFSAAGLSIEAVLRAACLNGIKAGGKANFLAVTKGPIKKESLRLIVIEGKIPELNCL